VSCCPSVSVPPCRRRDPSLPDEPLFLANVLLLLLDGYIHFSDTNDFCRAILGCFYDKVSSCVDDPLVIDPLFSYSCSLILRCCPGRARSVSRRPASSFPTFVFVRFCDEFATPRPRIFVDSPLTLKESTNTISPLDYISPRAPPTTLFLARFDSRHFHGFASRCSTTQVMFLVVVCLSHRTDATFSSSSH